MKQTTGPVTVDRGHRVGTPGGTSSSPSAAEARARRAAPGAWSEDLGRWGSDKWHLPGEGDRGPRCGEYYPEAVCETCGEPTFGTHTCGRRACPDCWTTWARKAGVRATTRIQAFRYTEPDDYRRQVAHAVVAPPEGDVMNEREFYDGRKKAARIAEEKGFRGFAVIGHPWRVTDEGKRRYREADPEYGVWVWLRNDVEEWRDFTYWSPHYHILGLTSSDMEPAAEGDEWAYHFIRSLESFDGIHDTSSHEDLYGAFRYLLSHTGFPAESTKQAVTWYGTLANSVFVETATESWQYEKPSEGVMSALEREVKAVAGVADEDDQEADEADEGDEEGVCPVDGCEGHLIHVFDVRAYLRQTNPPPEVERSMAAAIEWRLGKRLPPPGLKSPATEGEAREAFDAICRD